jgi:raffinose/stachyose/melibiose transport system permease protein
METGIAGKRAVPTPQQSRTRRRVQDNLTVILFLLPALALFLTFVVYPILQSAYYSLFDWKGLGKATDLVGLENYANILRDQIFLKSVRNGFVVVLLSLAIQLPLALALALMVGRDLPGRTFFRVIFFMPYVFSEVITAIMWLGLFNPDPDRGYLNALLTLIPGVKSVAWLGNTSIVLGCIFVVLTWKYFGLYMLLFMAGLQNIPREVEEAARMDGASGSAMLTRVTVPLLGSTIRTCVYLSVVGSLQQFVLVWVMTKGGPVNASEVMATYMYRFAFVRFWFGYGAAVALVMFLICLVFSLIYQRLARQPDYLSGM